jgi:hypothetical protein
MRLRRFFARLFRSTGVRISLLAFVIYNLNLRTITSFDTLPTEFLPISILAEGNLDLDEFPMLHEYPGHKDAKPYWVQRVRGHYMSTYPVMPAILSTPFYAIPVLLGWFGDLHSPGGLRRTLTLEMVTKVTASAAVACSVGVLYAALLDLVPPGSALALALIYGFATSSWAVSSQALWQSAWSQPLLAAALYCFVRGRRDSRYIVYASVPLALSVACRPPDLIFMFTFLALVALRHPRTLMPFLVFPLLVGLSLVAYNIYYFGTVTGGYESPTTSLVFGRGQLYWFGFPRWEYFAGLIASPSRGLVTHSPILVFALCGVVLCLGRGADPVLRTTAIATALTLLFFSCYAIWHGAFAFSYRLLVDLLPGLMLLMTPLWPRLIGGLRRRCAVVVLVALSVFVQIVGAFFFPCGWYESPVRGSLAPARFWDLSDVEVVRCLRAGPVRPDLVDFLAERLRRQSRRQAAERIKDGPNGAGGTGLDPQC